MVVSIAALISASRLRQDGDVGRTPTSRSVPGFSRLAFQSADRQAFAPFYTRIAADGVDAPDILWGVVAQERSAVQLRPPWWNEARGEVPA